MIILILCSIKIFHYKNILNIDINYKINKVEYRNLVLQSNIDIFLYDTSNILNNIQGKNEIDLNIKNELTDISYFYKDLLNKFKNINPPKEFKKNNEFLIISIENCLKDLDKILFNKDKELLKEYAINFIKSNDELIKVLEEIGSIDI